jgi:uncharacterized membrane protein
LLKTFLLSRWFHLLLLLVWIAIGAGLRLTQLTGKPPWTDEFATLVFSLGNSFQTVPLDQAISLDTLLQPLQPNPTLGASAVIHRLITEDHHPPLYFVLAHWWMRLFPSSDGYVSLWAARSLPALFGVASIPAVYGLGFLAFRSRLVAQGAAAMMAVSPYGVFLTQEARHYGLGILCVIASLCFLVVAIQYLHRRTLLPISLVLGWVLVNALGIATHYFFSLTLFTEFMVLLGIWLWGSRFAPLMGKLFPIPHSDSEALASLRASAVARLGASSPFANSHSSWLRIYAVAAGTFVSCLAWVPVWQMSHDTQMTQWIMNDRLTFLSVIGPIFQALAAWITMIALLPVESSALPVVLLSGAVMLVFFIWAVPIFYRGLKVQMAQPATCLATGAIGGFVFSAIALFFGITYFLGTDLTRGARYNFVYFPAVIVLLGAALASHWSVPKILQRAEASYKDNPQSQIREGEWQGENAEKLGKFSGELSKPQFPVPYKTNGKRAVALIWLMGLLSGITVVSNLGYQKYYRPDLLVPEMHKMSSVPILIATTHNTLVQTGEMMGLAWEFKRSLIQSSPLKPMFLLAHQEQQQCVSSAERVNVVDAGEGTTCRASSTLGKAIAQLPRPLDVWLVNFKASVVSEPPNCFTEDITQYQTTVNGYTARLYHCLADNSQAVR